MLLAYLYQTLQGSLIEELVAEEEDSPFYQYFDFAGVSSKEEVWIFLKKDMYYSGVHQKSNSLYTIVF